MPYLKHSIGNPSNISLDDICYLITISTVQNSLGQFIKSESERMVFCSKLSITRAEFNTSGLLGHKPNMMIIVDSDSYDDERYLRYEKTKLSIYKTFMRPDGFTELYCEVKQGD